MCKYFKIYAVLLAALGCGRAWCDVHFFCTQCNCGVNWKEWGSHAAKNHAGKYKKPFFLWCPSSNCQCPLAPVSPLEIGGQTVECADRHVRKHGDKYITYDLWCTKCNMVVPRHLWEMHLIRVHPDVGGLYQVFCPCGKQKSSQKKEDQFFGKSGQSESSGGLQGSIEFYTVSSGTQSGNFDAFEGEGDNSGWVCSCSSTYTQEDQLICKECKKDCKECGKDGKECEKDCQECGKDGKECKKDCKECGKDRIPSYLGLEHLFAKHKDKVKDYLPQYEFYCKECKKTFKTAQKWGSHVFKCSGRLEKEGEWKVFYCPLCGENPKTFYEKHAAESHPEQCIYCFEKIQSEKLREEHMKEAHRIFCPFCNQDQFEVPLAVHIVRAHEIWEGPCPWDRRREVRCKWCPPGLGGFRSFYADEAIQGRKMILYHFMQKHTSQIKELYWNPNGLYRFIVQQKLYNTQSVEPCKSLYFRYSGLCVLNGHSSHPSLDCGGCPYCKSLVIPKNNDQKWYTKIEAAKEHWKLFHAGMKYCRSCNSIHQEKDYDNHLLSSTHSDKCEPQAAYVKCPDCLKAVLMEDLYHGEKKHGKGFVFCTECKRWGTGSCPGCGKWVLDECEECSQRICGTCPQCEKKAFGSCSECQQYVTGECSECKKEVNGKCPTCVTKVLGKCPVCGNEVTGYCSRCKQRVVGKCSVCGSNCASGVCSNCKQKVGSIPRGYIAFESHMREKHNKKLQDKQPAKQAAEKLREQAETFKDDKDFRWCEECGVHVCNEDKDRIAHCRDRHKGSRNGWCERCRWDFDGTLSDHLGRKHREEVQRCKCGLYVFKDLDKRHLARHTYRCIQCRKDVPFEHMNKAHNCTPKCKPIANYGELVWDIRHDKQCPNRDWFMCNFLVCDFRGSSDDAFRQHIMKAHGCTEDCKYERNGYQFKITHCGCMYDEKIQVKCPCGECGVRGTKGSILEHVWLDHDCTWGKCGYGKDGFRHDANCQYIASITFFPCPFDGCRFWGVAKDMEKHMSGKHNCLDYYCTFKKGVPSHAVTCPNRVFKCPVCSNKPSVTKKHLRDFHGCHDFCHINEEGNGIEHHYECINKDQF